MAYKMAWKRERERERERKEIVETNIYNIYNQAPSPGNADNNNEKR